MKKCSKCNADKVINDFYIDKRNNLPRSECKSCQNERNRQWRANNKDKNKQINIKNQLSFKLKNIYKITEEKLDEFVKFSDGRCSICLLKTKLYIDHDHITGKVRGLLCNSCNLGLGKFKDDVAILKNAIKYLGR